MASDTNNCEHCLIGAPKNKRFCCVACCRCEHESEGEGGCDNICGGKEVGDE